MSKEDSLWLFKSYADQNDVDAVAEVIRRGTWWAGGEEIDEFESLIADRTDNEYGIAVNSGTTALYAMLITHGVDTGEVIVPSFTYPATANAVVAAGAKPVFADIERDSLALDVESVKRSITKETKAVMPIHFGGDVARDIYEIKEVCEENDLLLFEDACHSLGAAYFDDNVGSFGDAACFSFSFNKIISTGEGGMIVTDSKDARRKLDRLTAHGKNEDGEFVMAGHNFQMSSIAAALGISQAEKLDDIISERKRMAEYLSNSIEHSGDIHLPKFPPERDNVYQLYNIRFKKSGIQRDLAEYLDQKGIPTRVTYKPAHLTRYYRNEWGYSDGDLPVTEDVSEKILTLPFHLDLTDEDLEWIASSIDEYFEDHC